MHHSRRGSYTTSLGFLIVLILATILFGVLAYVAYQEATAKRIGNQDEPGSVEASLTSKQSEVDQLQASILNLRGKIKLRREAIQEEDLLLASRRAYYDDDAKAWLVGNADDSTRWDITSEWIQHTLAKMQAMREELESTKARQAIVPLEELIRHFRSKTQDVLRRISQMDDQMREDRERLERQLTALEEEHERQEKELNLLKSETATEISQLEQQIRELLELKLRWLGELQPDGRILEVARSGSDRVIIDLGNEHRLVRGMPFEVFHYRKGSYVKKGMVEVIETDRVNATCRIVEELEPHENPIAKGDLLGNPIYHRAESKVFVLEGEFKLYNRDDLAYFLRRMGATVVDDLQPGVDFMVAGDRSETAQDEAREYHVIAMTEPQLVQYLNTNFPPRTTQEAAE